MAHSLDMKLNYGKEDKETFAVLNLKNEFPFSCESTLKINGDVEQITCQIEGIPQSGFNPTKSSMLAFSYQMGEKEPDSNKRKMVLKVVPINGAKLQLFSVFSDLKTEKPIPVTRQTHSKSYQIVAYYKKLPFLKPDDNLTKRDSINFPVSIPNTATPMVGELDINRKPLDYTAGKDLDEFIQIRSLMHARKYADALAKISKASQTYPDSLFTKDMIYYAIVALSKLKDKSSQDYLLDAGVKWVKTYASDDHAPEVMYLLAKTFLQQNKAKDAFYYLTRISEEYPKTRYSSLAKMQIANTLKSQSDIKRAPLIYREAYKDAQDVDTASQVAISWARFNLRNKDYEYANELFNKVYTVYPAYFLTDQDESMTIIKELEEEEQYKTAANIARYLSGYTKISDDKHAQLLNKASDFYTKIGDFDSAHKINLDFLHYHPSHKLAEKIRERDNSLLFEIGGDYKTKMQRYDTIIATYPNSESSKKAYALKAQLYYENKEYDKIIEMQLLLPEDSPIIQTAIDNQVVEYLKEHNCDGITGVLSKAHKVSLNVAQSLDVFECLYNRTAYQKANQLFSGLNKYIKDGENQLRWLYLQANTLFALGENKAGIKAGRDVLDLAFATGNTKYYDISFKMFNVFYNDESTRHEALKLSAKMDQWFPNDKRMLAVHFTLLNEAQQKNDPLALKSEANTIMAIQNKVKDYGFSPYVNFIHINSLIDENKYKEALSELEVLKRFQLNLDDKQQRFYKIANINYTLKNMEESKKALDKCVALGTTTSWGTLCNNALSLHDSSLE
ncbi:hypothetical protein CQA53_07710 [Helicobacter didelphidarum]|uniref:DUF7494 domain-containing protein n=2 Tax=Helicobacter didelphidarum TaxID=2040648 RepID=A0A3D8IHM8_9HELI|nr:hypothetical protein CQA53_07710 [Helicobacter didelphidarum]